MGLKYMGKVSKEYGNGLDLMNRWFG